MEKASSNKAPRAAKAPGSPKRGAGKDPGGGKRRMK